MKIQLSDHFTYGKLLRFVAPSIVMMVFTSIYGVVDGLFVSNFVGKTAFAAVNLIMPVATGLGALGFMMGTGGSALVAKTLGEGQSERASRLFTMLVIVAALGGAVLAVVGIFITKPVAVALGATGEMLENATVYSVTLLSGLPFFTLQNVFACFMATAEKPKLGLAITVAAGVTNMILDAVFIVGLKLGVLGAALATVASQIVGSVVPVIYFLNKNNSSLLRFLKPEFDFKSLLKVCGNGSSELMTNLSISVVNMAYNYQLLKIAGENGVAAYGTIMYVNWIFISIFLGFSLGTSPIIGFHYGLGNRAELKNVLRKCLVVVGATGVVLAGTAMALSTPLAELFVGYDETLLQMTARGFLIYSTAFFVNGFNVFGSSFFTALNNGLVSAVISFGRLLLFQMIVVFTLPLLMGLDGIWLSITVAELMALIVTAIFFATNRKKYGY